MELYFHKSTKFSDKNLKKQATFVRSMVKKVMQNKMKNISVGLYQSIQKLVNKIENNERITSMIKANDEGLKNL